MCLELQITSIENTVEPRNDDLENYCIQENAPKGGLKDEITQHFNHNWEGERNFA